MVKVQEFQVVNPGPRVGTSAVYTDLVYRNNKAVLIIYPTNQLCIKEGKVEDLLYGLSILKVISKAMC